MKTLTRYSTLGLIAFAAACGSRHVQTGSPATSAVTADATIRDASGKEVGTATFMETSAGLHITGTVSNLPAGTHGIHIHAIGKCEAPFTSAGGHFNPTAHQHGYDNPAGPHLGDLRNIVIPTSGSVKIDAVANGVTLAGANALLDADGAAIVIHATADDYKTDPAGNSGARIACGVITRR